jgi:arylsulfatase A-like enzyme
VSRGAPLAALGAWIAAVSVEFSPSGALLFVFASSWVGVAGAIAARAFAPGARRLAGAVAAFAVAAPIAGVVANDPGRGPRLPPPEQPARAHAPNVLVFMIDTLRADHTAPSGYATDTTPRLRSLLEERTTVFTQAMSTAASTVPAVNSLFTSQLPAGPATARRPTADAWTLGTAFRTAGYETAAFTANSLVSGPGFQNGFRWFRATLGYSYFIRSFALMRLFNGGRKKGVMRHTETWKLHKEDGVRITAAARRWLEEVRDQPFFAYVHILDPHWPYYDRGFGLLDAQTRDVAEPFELLKLLNLRRHAAGNARYRGTPLLRELVGRYDEEVRFADRALGELLDALVEQGVDQRTLVVILGDHGEEFFEHNSFGHGHDVYQHLVHVPLIFRWPEEPRFARMPQRVDQPISLLDVLPTLSDYFDLPPPPRPVLGHSLRPLLEESHTGDWHPVVSEVLWPRRAMGSYREGRHKVRLSYNYEAGPLRPSSVQVFDLAADPSESQPLEADDPRVSALVERALRAHHRAFSARPVGRAAADASEDAPDPDVDAVERLRALGYVY